MTGSLVVLFGRDVEDRTTGYIFRHLTDIKAISRAVSRVPSRFRKKTPITRNRWSAGLRIPVYLLLRERIDQRFYLGYMARHGYRIRTGLHIQAQERFGI
jgi:hypothetical protein